MKIYEQVDFLSEYFGELFALVYAEFETRNIFNIVD